LLDGDIVFNNTPEPNVVSVMRNSNAYDTSNVVINDDGSENEKLDKADTFDNRQLPIIYDDTGDTLAFTATAHNE